MDLQKEKENVKDFKKELHITLFLCKSLLIHFLQT